MKDYKYLVSSKLVDKVSKRDDAATFFVSCLGASLGIICMVWFIDGVLG